MLEFEDEDSGIRVKRLWSLYNPAQGGRFYADILEMPEDQRKRMIRQYAKFLKQLRTVRRAMADYFAGQRFFDFYPSDSEDDEEEAKAPLPSPRRESVRHERP
jgi:hypothetical protein